LSFHYHWILLQSKHIYFSCIKLWFCRILLPCWMDFLVCSIYKVNNPIILEANSRNFILMPMKHSALILEASVVYNKTLFSCVGSARV
jgi:hypothetical protein